MLDKWDVISDSPARLLCLGISHLAERRAPLIHERARRRKWGSCFGAVSSVWLLEMMGDKEEVRERANYR